MKPFGILAIAIGALLVFFGGVIGFETGFGLRVVNFPTIIIGGIFVLSGVILFAASPQDAANSQTSDPVSPSSEPNIAYDRNRWSALVKYDDEIALIARKLQPFGQKWVDEFAASYLALNDKSYLPNLVQKIIASMKKESELPPMPPIEGQQNLPYALTPSSIKILQQAKAGGYEVELSAKEKCVVARLEGIKGTWYLASNQDIENFGRDAVSLFRRASY